MPQVKERVAVNRHCAKAARALAAGDANHEEAAREMKAASDDGLTQRQIAAEVGCSHVRVGRMLRAFAVLGTRGYQTWDEAVAGTRDRSNERRTLAEQIAAATPEELDEAHAAVVERRAGEIAAGAPARSTPARPTPAGDGEDSLLALVTAVRELVETLRPTRRNVNALRKTAREFDGAADALEGRL